MSVTLHQAGHLIQVGDPERSFPFNDHLRNQPGRQESSFGLQALSQCFPLGSFIIRFLMPGRPEAKTRIILLMTVKSYSFQRFPSRNLPTHIKGAYWRASPIWRCGQAGRTRTRTGMCTARPTDLHCRDRKHPPVRIEEETSNAVAHHPRASPATRPQLVARRQNRAATTGVRELGG